MRKLLGLIAGVALALSVSTAPAEAYVRGGIYVGVPAASISIGPGYRYYDPYYYPRYNRAYYRTYYGPSRHYYRPYRHHNGPYYRHNRHYRHW
ncbi:MAG: hypothetical protein M3R00_08240 [Pseudomonadota bacterium]|nr:hypothetical protein [Pseudomonadota bacterium]